MEPLAVTRCKMRVSSVSRSMNDKGETESETVKLSAVYGTGETENAKWSKWTPSADLSITISNPGAIGKLSKGHEYFVDFIPV